MKITINLFIPIKKPPSSLVIDHFFPGGMIKKYVFDSNIN